ncbi:flavin-containing monooxygenase [Cryptosporangium minutisporangium]|uniref:NAD(P)/FAD-dependent oxidoreductase n=1 Tax=Cryptosporangium minutisporangium TaxID=113569 RepID=A0ABP6TBS8_9ACTN
MTETAEVPAAIGDGGGTPHVRVAVIGTGFGGIGAAVRLKGVGIHDFVLLERADAIGGTWRDNTYPGCACDVPSHLYSFSFAPNPRWPRSFSAQPDIRRYLEDVVDRFGVRPHVRFHTEVLDATWVESERHWHLRTTTGELTATVLISAAGPLSDPQVPAVPGLAGFSGEVWHSSRWNHDYDLTGKRVAVIGTGASAIQFVPRIQPRVGELTVFQRTAPWILPRADRPITRTERAVFSRSALAQKAARAGVYLVREAEVPGFILTPAILRAAEVAGKAHIRRAIADPALRAAVTPNFRLGCKRVLLSNDWYPALTQPNVSLVNAGLTAVQGDTVVGSDGTRRDVDAIIFGTGFHVTDMPIAQRITGRGGVRLADRWADGMEALRGTTVHGYPNFFLLIGPNSGLSHSSMVFIIESQLNYVIDALVTMDRHQLGTVEARHDAQQRWNALLDRRMKRTIWVNGGCHSWYQDANGRVTTQWPSSTWRFRLVTRKFDVGEYRLTATPALAVAARRE